MKKYKCFMDFEYTTTGNTKLDLENDNVEIISIAGVVIDENNKTVDEFHSIIRPIKNVVIHPFCTELTGITQDMVDEANFFGAVADDFMKFIKKYRDESLFIYVWGDFDAIALDRTFEITRYSGDFEYIRNKIVNIQKRICCSITYKGKVVKSVWGLQNVKKAYDLTISENQHNALYDARDLRDIYIAYKNNYHKNYTFIKYIYEKSLYNSILDIHNKTLYFNKIPGEVKYGLANLFKNTVHKGMKTKGVDFNKKTMQFKEYEYCVKADNELKKIIKMDTEIVRYSNTQMIAKINSKRDIVSGVEVERLVFALYFATKSKKLETEYIITPAFEIPIIPRNINALTVFVKKLKQYDDMYDVNSTFEDCYNLGSKIE